MKTLFALLSIGLMTLVADVTTTGLSIGDKAPMTDVPMMDISGEKMTLQQMAGENGLLVVFSCNTCPFVVGNAEKSEGWEGRYNDYVMAGQKTGINMVLVNSNEAKRGQGDSFDDMVARAKKQGYMSKYVLDENHMLADAFGAKTTPHVYLFNKEMALVYQGAIDDNVNKAEDVKEYYLLDAMKATMDGQPVKVQETKAIGCSIKRVKK